MRYTTTTPTSTTICIPRIKRTIQKYFIKEKMTRCRFGVIQSIVEKPLRNDIDYKKVTIRLILNNEMNGKYLLENTKEGMALKVVYNGSDYWRIFNVG